MDRSKKSAKKRSGVGATRPRSTVDLEAFDIGSQRLRERVELRCREEWLATFGREWDPAVAFRNHEEIDLEKRARAAHHQLRRALVAALDVLLDAERAAVKQATSCLGAADRECELDDPAVREWRRGKGLGGEAMCALTRFLENVELRIFDLDRDRGDLREFAEREQRRIAKSLKEAEEVFKKAPTKKNEQTLRAARREQDQLRQLEPFLARRSGCDWTSLVTRAFLAEQWGGDTAKLLPDRDGPLFSGEAIGAPESKPFASREMALIKKRPARTSRTSGADRVTEVTLTARGLAVMSLLSGNWPSVRGPSTNKGFRVEDVIQAERRAMQNSLNKAKERRGGKA